MESTVRLFKGSDFRHSEDPNGMALEAAQEYYNSPWEDGWVADQMTFGSDNSYNADASILIAVTAFKEEPWFPEQEEQQFEPIKQISEYESLQRWIEKFIDDIPRFIEELGVENFLLASLPEFKRYLKGRYGSNTGDLPTDETKTTS
jgi:hypothetical protein